jgi:hypothetical protein
MKINARFPDKLIKEINSLAKGKNAVDSMEIALSDWAVQQKVRRLNRRIARRPLQFRKGFTATRARAASRPA